MAHPNIEFSVDESVARLMINRPESRNALTKAMYAEIRDICRRVQVDDEINVLVIEGSQGSFAVGGDLKEMLDTLSTGDPAAILTYDEYLPFDALRTLRKPTIAKIDGLCMGGGLTLALMCDIQIATSRSKFAMPEARVGIVDGHLPRLLRDRIPSARLRYWLYSGSTFGSEEAYDAGLLTRVVEPEALDHEVAGVLDELRSSSLQAIVLYKEIMNETWALSSMDDAYKTLLSEEVRERLFRFAGKSTK